MGYTSKKLYLCFMIKITIEVPGVNPGSILQVNQEALNAVQEVRGSKVLFDEGYVTAIRDVLHLIHEIPSLNNQEILRRNLQEEVNQMGVKRVS